MQLSIFVLVVLDMLKPFCDPLCFCSTGLIGCITFIVDQCMLAYNCTLGYGRSRSVFGTSEFEIVRDFSKEIRKFTFNIDSVDDHTRRDRPTRIIMK